MTEVKVGLCAVLRDVNLTVLVRAHCTRINVNVGVELLRGNLESSCLEKSSERSRRDSLAEAGNNAACYKDVFCHKCPSVYL